MILFVDSDEYGKNYQNMEQHANYNLDDIVTPINADRLEELLLKSNYNKKDRDFLTIGFKEGFDINYTGPKNRRDQSRNIPLKSGTSM